MCLPFHFYSTHFYCHPIFIPKWNANKGQTVSASDIFSKNMGTEQKNHRHNWKSSRIRNNVVKCLNVNWKYVIITQINIVCLFGYGIYGDCSLEISKTYVKGRFLSIHFKSLILNGEYWPHFRHESPFDSNKWPSFCRKSKTKLTLSL